MAAQPWHFLCEERYGNVISNLQQTLRISRFLKPCATTFSEAESASNRAPLLFERFSTTSHKWPPKVNFKGWALPQKNWNGWVENLSPKYCVLWEQTRITDSIMGSCYDIRPIKEIILCLVEFWCPKTNSFAFPWGEATITLEDVMILGGFSVLGESVMKPVATSAVEKKKMVEAMKREKSTMSHSKSKKASHSGWMNHFMENSGEFEHVAFLSLWLSRYVFPLPAKETISSDVFPIAAHLSQGTKMALAPAVLACLYQSLSLLKKQASASSSTDEITVFAPFKLVLLWAFEHFPSLVQKPPNELNPGEPRVARWHKLNFKSDSSVITAVLTSSNSFQWRPYAAEISNWNCSSYYTAEKHLPVDSETNSDEELQSYAVCLRMCYLVGVNCKEKYMPHRVAMQFGMDQDLPGEFSGSAFGLRSSIFFVPPRFFEPGVSTRYFDWWKESEFFCKGKERDILRRNSHTFLSPRSNKGETISQPSTEYKAKEVKIEELKFDGRNENFDVKIKSEDETLERSRLIEEVKRTESFGLRSPKSVFQTSAAIEHHSSVINQSSSTGIFPEFVESDHVAFSGNLKKMAEDDSKDINRASRSASLDELKTRERSFPAATDGILDCKETTSRTKSNNGDCTKKLKRDIEDKDEATMDFERVNLGINHGNEAEGSEENKESTAASSLNSDVNVDKSSLLRTPAAFQIFDLERRIQKVEKLLGLSSDG